MSRANRRSAKGGLDFWERGSSSGYMSLLRSLAALFVGAVLILIGYAMWRSPAINWAELSSIVATLVATIRSEIVRTVRDPFSALGFIVLVFGVWVFSRAVKSFRRE